MNTNRIEMEQEVALKLLLQGVRSHFRRAFKIILIMGVILVGLALFFSKDLFLVRSNGSIIFAEHAFLEVGLFLGFFSLMFVVGLVSTYKQSRVFKRKDYQWFIHQPQRIERYELVSGKPVRLTLFGKNQKALLISNQSEREIENLLFKAFPHLKPLEIKAFSEQREKKVDLLQQQRVNLTAPQNIPESFRGYFSPPPSFLESFGVFWYVFLVLLIVLVLGGLTSYSLIPPFWFFKEDNPLHIILIFPVILVFLMGEGNYQSHKKTIHAFKYPHEVVWIYWQKTKHSVNGIPSGTSEALVLADREGNRHDLGILEDEKDYAYDWATLYFNKAITGHRYEWKELYEKDAAMFLQRVKSAKMNKND